MTDRAQMIQGYVNDMLAVEREAHSAVRRQKHDASVKQYAEASRVIDRIEDTLDQHIAELQKCLQVMGADESMLKKAVGTALGAVGGIYDKIRSDDRVSRMLRDDYTALSFASVCYEMLHTTALAAGDSVVADLAIRHLRDYAPLVIEVTDVLPHVLTDELAAEGKIQVDPSAAREAVRNTRAAWEQSSNAAS
jgi:ferritin-like metal-binding protein YciE